MLAEYELQHEENSTLGALQPDADAVACPMCRQRRYTTRNGYDRTGSLHPVTMCICMYIMSICM